MKTPDVQGIDTIIGMVRGRQGEPGRGLQIDGLVDTFIELPAAADNNKKVYGVKTGDIYTYYWSNGVSWFSLGTFQGEQGEKGDAFTYDDFTEEQLSSLVGPTGADGEDGADGISPTVTITDTTGGHTVTITDAEHPQGQSFLMRDTVIVDSSLDTSSENPVQNKVIANALGNVETILASVVSI